MNVEIRPLNTKVNQSLIEQVGIVDTIRFLNQFHASHTDYVQEHHQLAQKLTLDGIFNDIDNLTEK